MAVLMKPVDLGPAGQLGLDDGADMEVTRFEKHGLDLVERIEPK